MLFTYAQQADAILAIQSFANPVLTALFKTFTFLGEEIFFLIAIPVLWFFIDSRFALRMAILLFSSYLINTYFKGLLGEPRPFQFDSRITAMTHEPSNGIPSGHAQTSVVFWCYLAHSFNRRWMWVMAFTLIAAVSFSRLYLGVHFFTDLVGGWLIGGVWLGNYIYLSGFLEKLAARWNRSVQLAASIAIPFVGATIAPTATGLAAMGALMGILCGVVLTPWINHGKGAYLKTVAPTRERLARFAISMLYLLVSYVGLKYAFPELGPGQELFRFLRYALVAMSITFWGPVTYTLLFQRDRKA